MSARDYATGDELAQMQREYQRELEKLESRIEREIAAARYLARTQAIPHPAAMARDLRDEIGEVRDAVLAMSKVIDRLQAAVEDLSL